MDGVLNGFLFILLALLYAGVLTAWDAGIFAIAALVLGPLVDWGPPAF